MASAFCRSQQISYVNAFASIPKQQKARPILSSTYHPQSFAVKNILFHHPSIIQANPSTDTDFSEPPLVVYRWDGNFRDLSVLNLHLFHHPSSAPEPSPDSAATSARMHFSLHPSHFLKVNIPSKRNLHAQAAML